MSEQSEKGLLAKQLEACRFNKCLLLLQCGKVGSSGVGVFRGSVPRPDGHGPFLYADTAVCISEGEAVCDRTCLPWAYFVLISPREFSSNVHAKTVTLS